MVSQVDLSLRAPSVISRSSRHRRQGRSHAGSSSFVPTNEFPVFSHTGDVEILVKAGAGGRTIRYLLHRIILTQCSGFFEAGTSGEWSKARPPTWTGTGTGELARIGEEGSGSERGSAEGRTRWRYELDPGAGQDDIPMLVQKEEALPTSMFGSHSNSNDRPPAIRTKPPPSSTSNPSFFRSVANLGLSSQSHAAPPADQDLLNDYDNLFRIFYNYPPTLDAIDIATAYVQCKSLLTLADLYDALAVVGPRIDHHLLQFQGRLWKQIAKYPSSYLKLGHLAQSKSIFCEAMIHVVGAWPMGERHLRDQLPETVLEIIEDKVDELDDLVGKIEGRLFRLNLTTSRGERVTPGNSYVDWLAVSLFRQWLADATAPPPPPVIPILRDNHTRGQHSRNNTGSITQRSTSLTSQPLPPPPTTSPNLGRVFRILGGAPQGYLGHDECKRFLKLSEAYYSRENLKRFERRLEELKGMARLVVQPLMGCGLLGGDGGVGYLVCTRVGERDFPWVT